MKILLPIFLLFLPFQGFCDFADFWTIKLNDSTIYDSREDKYSWNRIHSLKYSDLKLSEGDTMTISYWTDTPCPDCQYNLLLTDSTMQKKQVFQKEGYAVFHLAFSDFELLRSGPTDFIYFRSDQQHMMRILRIE